MTLELDLTSLPDQVPPEGQVDLAEIRNQGYDPVINLEAEVRGHPDYCLLSKTGRDGTFEPRIRWHTTLASGATLPVYVWRDGSQGQLEAQIDFVGDVPVPEGPTDEEMDEVYRSLGVKPPAQKKWWQRWRR